MEKKKNQRRIIVLFHGGLGNQMYEYAFLRWLQFKFPYYEIKADISEYKIFSAHQGFELKRIFPDLKLEIAGGRELFRCLGELPRFYGGRGKEIVEKYIRIPLNNHLFHLKSEIVFEEDEKCSANEIQNALMNGCKYFSGYWQSRDFFSEYRNEIRAEFRFKEFEDERNLQLLENVQNCESVAIHVRRGDYVSAGIPVMKMEYYQKAVERISERVKKPVFYIFSDDKYYVKENFDWLEKKEIVDYNVGKESYKDMQLMSCCKHIITANSTFSEWAALLNTNADKIVIYPEDIYL